MRRLWSGLLALAWLLGSLFLEDGEALAALLESARDRLWRR